MKTTLNFLLFALLTLAGTQLALASSGCTSHEKKETKAKALFVSLKMKQKGYKLKESYFDCTTTRSKESYTVKNVKGNKKHVFIVVGSKYAKDIDSWLQTMDGQTIDSDTKSDSVPIVQVTSSFTMKLRLRIRAYNSHASSAEIAILHYVK